MTTQVSYDGAAVSRVTRFTNLRQVFEEKNLPLFLFRACQPLSEYVETSNRLYGKEFLWKKRYEWYNRRRRRALK